MPVRKMPIDVDYCSNWSIRDAIREFIQNALDTHTITSIKHLGSFAIIQDQSTGVKMRDFLLGRTTKRDDNTVIGQFGEGLAIGCLVMARAGRLVEIRTNEQVFKASIKSDRVWGGKILAFEVGKAERPQTGTTVYVECSQAELQDAESLFLQLCPKTLITPTSAGDIIDSPGNFYVNGVKVTTGDSIFGYDFRQAKSLINRDRGSIDHTAVRVAVSNVLSACDDVEVAKQILTTAEKGVVANGQNFIELATDFRPIVPTWKEAVQSLYGEDVCLYRAGDTLANNDMKSRGWRVLEFPWNLSFLLHMADVLRYSDETRKDFQHVVEVHPTPEEQEMLATAERVCKLPCELCRLRTDHFTSIVEFPDDNQYGQTVYEEDRINISRTALQSLEQTVATLLHERVHLTTFQPDYSSGFEAAAFESLATLAIAMSEKEKVC